MQSAIVCRSFRFKNKKKMQNILRFFYSQFFCLASCRNKYNVSIWFGFERWCSTLKLNRKQRNESTTWRVYTPLQWISKKGYLKERRWWWWCLRMYFYRPLNAIGKVWPVSFSFKCCHTFYTFTYVVLYAILFCFQTVCCFVYLRKQRGNRSLNYHQNKIELCMCDYDFNDRYCSFNIDGIAKWFVVAFLCLFNLLSKRFLFIFKHNLQFIAKSDNFLFQKKKYNLFFPVCICPLIVIGTRKSEV